MSVHIKDGPPLHGESKCYTCSRAHIQYGFRESEEVVRCQATYPKHRVRFRVRDCSSYIELEHQTLKQNEEIAWVVEPRGSKQRAGFVSVSDLRGVEDVIDLILDKDK
jgi:hypothetical protein